MKQNELEIQMSRSNKILELLQSKKIESTKIGLTVGPSVSLHEFETSKKISVARVKKIENDLANIFSVIGVRITIPFNTRNIIRIEVPNQNREQVTFQSILESKEFVNSKAELPVFLGKTVLNENYIIDLAFLSHLMLIGDQPQGKSDLLHTIINSLITKKKPEELKLVLMDFEKDEFDIYTTIEKQFLTKLPDETNPIIRNIQAAKKTIISLNQELNSRYSLLRKAKVVNIKGYNNKFRKGKINIENGFSYMPRIVVVINDFEELIISKGVSFQLFISRLAQMGRNLGIHLIIATKGISKKIITPILKANFCNRISFRMESINDSKIVLDSSAANQLIGNGDILFYLGYNLIRIQCVIINRNEIENTCKFIQSETNIPLQFFLPEVEEI